MSLSVIAITLNIRNNRNYPVRINVLGSPVNPLDTVNSTTEYRWDVTAYTASVSDTLVLEYKVSGAAVFSTFTYQLSNANTEALILALDSLGIGYFQAYTEAGQLYLSTYNNNVIFGNITITANGATTTSTTTSTTTAAPTTSTTTSTTTAAPTTSTTTSTTTAAPTTSTTTSTTTAAPTTSTTSTTTTLPTTSTTSTTTTVAPTTTTSTTTTTTTVNYVTFTLAQSFISGAQACSDYPTVNTTLYYAALGSTLTNGTIIYLDSALTILAPDAFYSNGVDYWNTGASSGNLQNQTSCGFTSTSTTSTTTTLAPTTTSTTTSTTTDAPTTSTTTSTTTDAPTTTSTTTSTTTEAPTTSTTTSTTTEAPTTTSTTTSTTTEAPTTTSTTTSTTTEAPTTTSTTTSTTTEAPTTTSTTTSTTTEAPTTTSTTTSTTTEAPTTTSTTTSTTTEAPTTTSTTTSTTTEAPTTTSTTTSTTTEAPTTTTSTTTSTTTAAITCNNYQIEGAPSIDVEWLECDGTPNSDTVTTAILICAQTGSVSQTGGAGNIVQLGPCSGPPTTTTTTTSTTTEAPTTTSTTTSTTTEAPTTTSTTTTTTTLPFINMSLAASYTGVSEMLINLGIIGTLPDAGVLSFDWCTDSNASGTATYNLNSGITTGNYDIPSINLSSTGGNTFSTIWGSYTYNVDVSSPTTVTEFYVKGATLTYTTADTTYQYVISFLNVDNACANPVSETDVCLANC